MQRLVRYPTAAEFLRDVHDYLAVREAANSLILGLAIRLVGEPHAFGSTPPYFAAVFDEAGPAMVAMMTPPYNLILSAEGKIAEEGLELLARDLMRSELPVPGAQGPTGLAEQFAASWARLAGVTSRRGISLRLYESREVIPPRDSPGSLRVATVADMELVIAWMDAFHREAVPHEPPSPSGLTQRRIMAGDAFLWDDNGAVSMAFKSRPTQHGISVGPVYTPPEFRRRGYAASCVAALSQQLLDTGFQYCALFTDLSNPTSNDIYQQVGYRPICDFQEIVFMPEGTHEPATP